MKIRDEPKFRLGRVFYAITEDDYLQYMGDDYLLSEYRALAEVYGEDVYCCIMYADNIAQHRVYASGYQV